MKSEDNGLIKDIKEKKIGSGSCSQGIIIKYLMLLFCKCTIV